MDLQSEHLSRRERREMKKRADDVGSGSVIRSLVLWGGAIVVVVMGIFWLFSGAKNGASSEPAVVEMEIGEKEWVKGNANGRLTIVEYSDFQCPACRGYQPILDEVVKANPEVRLIYRHFPLRSIHKNAQMAAQAAEAAGMQGKFFEMHDLLFAGQEDWALLRDPVAKFGEYASQLKLDTDKFDKDLRSKEVEDLVEEDYKSAMRLRVNSTPSIFINGKKVASPRSKDEFLKLLSSM